jgi:glycosyltransferase EpsE
MGNIRYMTKPLVSVIMTAYNCDKFIKESLDSILNQTFKDFEIIIYNDCSTDFTKDIICNFFKDYNLSRKIIINPIVGENIGCGPGRNKAIVKASGKYIAIFDADDVSFPGRLEEETNFLEENDDVFCVSAWAQVIDKKGEYIKTFDYPLEFSDDIKEEILVNHNNPIIDPCSMFRRDTFNKLGGYNKKWKLIPDFNLWTRAAMEGYNFYNIQRPLVFYRKYKESVTGKYEMETVREHYKMCREII